MTHAKHVRLNVGHDSVQELSQHNCSNLRINEGWSKAAVAYSREMAVQVLCTIHGLQCSDHA